MTEYNTKTTSALVPWQESEELKYTFGGCTEIHTDGSRATDAVSCGMAPAAVTRSRSLNAVAFIFAAGAYAIVLALSFSSEATVRRWQDIFVKRTRGVASGIVKRETGYSAGRHLTGVFQEVNIYSRDRSIWYPLRSQTCRKEGN